MYEDRRQSAYTITGSNSLGNDVKSSDNTQNDATLKQLFTKINCNTDYGYVVGLIHYNYSRHSLLIYLFTQWKQKELTTSNELIKLCMQDRNTDIYKYLLSDFNRKNRHIEWDKPSYESEISSLTHDCSRQLVDKLSIYIYMLESRRKKPPLYDTKYALIFRPALI